MSASLIYYLPLVIFIIAGIYFSIKAKKLTVAGALTGGVTGVVIFSGTGYTGIIMLCFFFISGTVATSWKKKEKQQFKSAEDRSLKRKAGQVLANGGAAAITSLLICFIPAKAELFRLMTGACLASAVADTLSSELGMVYGRRFYNVITFRTDRKGLDGVISVEGTLIGLAGSIMIALIYALGYGFNITFLFIVIAGTIGNLSDSILGASLERKNYISNDMVNFLNTVMASLAAWLCFVLL